MLGEPPPCCLSDILVYVSQHCFLQLFQGVRRLKVSMQALTLCGCCSQSNAQLTCITMYQERILVTRDAQIIVSKSQYDQGSIQKAVDATFVKGKIYDNILMK